MMVSTKTLNEVTNKSKFDWIISINGLTRFLSYYCGQRTQDSGRMNLFVCPIFLLWSKGLFNITEKNYNCTWKRTKKRRTIKTCKWDVLYSKWFQCVLDDDETFENGEDKPYHERSEGSLYPLFIDQSTSPSSSTPWLASFLMFPKLIISIYWKFALWSIYGITWQIIVQ